MTKLALRFFCTIGLIGLIALSSQAQNLVVPNDTVICLGDSVNLDVTIIDSSLFPAPYTFLWSPATALSCFNCHDPIASPGLTTTYTVIVTDSTNTQDSAAITVRVNFIFASVKRDSICIGDTSQLTAYTCSSYGELDDGFESGNFASWVDEGGAYTKQLTTINPANGNYALEFIGGKVLHWMDIAAAITGQKHADNIVVTAAVDNVSFKRPIKLGDVLTIKARVTRTFNTSMEIFIEVWSENIPNKTIYKSNEAYYTFVALDDSGNPTKVPQVSPETDEEKTQYEHALKRRELRLILGGKIKPEDATELKNLLEGL